MAALTASCIDLNIQGNGAYSILKQLATMALQNGFITDSHQFLQTLLLREKMHSTGFGSGIAVPHGKSACVKQPFVLFARKAQAIDWKASDGEDVNCWICLGVPQSGEEDQVKIIGTLCRKIIHQDFIHQLRRGKHLVGVASSQLMVRSAGLKIPEDVSIVGFDDYVLGRYFSPRLTTIEHPKEKMGLDAGRMIMSLIDGEEVKPIEYDAKLIFNDSVRKLN